MYIVFEIQTYDNGTVGTLTTSFEDQLAAEAQFHTVLAAAALSVLPKHAAVLMSNEGFVLRSECYKHDPAPAQITEEPEEPAEPVADPETLEGGAE